MGPLTACDALYKWDDLLLSWSPFLDRVPLTRWMDGHRLVLLACCGLAFVAGLLTRLVIAMNS